MVAFLPILVLASTLKPEANRPVYVLADESHYTKADFKIRARLPSVRNLVAYRVLFGKPDRTGVVVCRAVKVGELHHFKEAMPQYARPEGTEAAAFQSRGYKYEVSDRIDFWRVAPLAHLGGATLKDSIGMGAWLPGRRAFAVFERPGPPDTAGIDPVTRRSLAPSPFLGYATRVLSPEGRTLAYLPRTLEIVGSPPPGPLLAVRHSMRDEEIVDAVVEFDPTKLGRAIAAGLVRFVRLDARYRPVAAVPWRRAARLLLGPGGDLRSLARVANPTVGLLGYARNWAVFRAAELGPRKDSWYGWVYDQLGFPTPKARYVRWDGDVPKSDYAVGSDGSLLVGNSVPVKGELPCVVVSPRGKRRFLIRGLGSGRTTVFWGR